MNAAFLLVTSAWLAGQAAPPPPAKPAPPPAHAAPVAHSACCDTDTCCESCGLFDRLRAWFHRHDDCCDPCDKVVEHHKAAPAHPDCGKAASCDDSDCRPRLLDRLRALFHRDDCCDDCAAAPHGAPPPRAEPIPAPKSTTPPKEMPKGSTSGAGIIMPQPALAPATTLIIDR